MNMLLSWIVGIETRPQLCRLLGIVLVDDKSKMIETLFDHVYVRTGGSTNMNNSSSFLMMTNGV